MRKTPSQPRSKFTVEAILDAAAQVLLEIGYSNASTNKIADRAGVSIGSLYEYFPGKEAIFAEVRRQEDRRLFDLAASHPEPQTVKDWLREHNAMYIEFVRSNLALHAALLNEVPQFAIVQKELWLYRYYIPWAVKFLRSHQDELRPFGELTKAVSFLVRVGRSGVDNYVLHSPEALADPAFLDMIVDLCEQYLLKR